MPELVRSPFIFQDDFSQGLNGWRSLRTGSITVASTLFPGPSLYHDGRTNGGRCMILGAGIGQNLQAQALKRMSLWDGLFHWRLSCGWTATSNNWLRHLRFAIDYSNTSNRYWFEIDYRHYDEAATQPSPLWRVETGTVDASVKTTTGITQLLPFNEWGKVNYFDIELVFNTRDKKYDSLRINNDVYSLKSLAGPAADARLMSGGFPIWDRGMNTILIIQGRTNNSSADPYLLVDSTSAWIS